MKQYGWLLQLQGWSNTSWHGIHTNLFGQAVMLHLRRPRPVYMRWTASQHLRVTCTCAQAMPPDASKSLYGWESSSPGKHKPLQPYGSCSCQARLDRGEPARQHGAHASDTCKQPGHTLEQARGKQISLRCKAIRHIASKEQLAPTVPAQQLMPASAMQEGDATFEGEQQRLPRPAVSQGLERLPVEQVGHAQAQQEAYCHILPVMPVVLRTGRLRLAGRAGRPPAVRSGVRASCRALLSPRRSGHCPPKGPGLACPGHSQTSQRGQHLSHPARNDGCSWVTPMQCCAWRTLQHASQAAMSRTGRGAPGGAPAGA